MNRRNALVAMLFVSVAISMAGSSLATGYTSKVVARVKDRNLKPVAGATVDLYCSNQWVAQAVTNSRGVCTFSKLPAGSYRVEGYKKNVGSGSDSGQLIPGSGPWYANIRLR